MLTVGSLFDGVGCFSKAFADAGFNLRWTCEIDANCRRVTAARFPGVRQHEDVTTLKGADLEPVDVVVGGSPCQDWSVAGKRAGLDGGRAPLFVHLVRVAREVGASWLLWENVPGVFSQGKGADFAFVLGQFTGCEPEVPEGGWRNTGWGWGPLGAVCWRVCDARHWGVPQRRRRVFALVRLGDLGGLAGEAPRPDLRRLLRLPAEVLLEPEGVFGHPAPRREAGAGDTPSVTPGARRASGNRSGELLTTLALASMGEGVAPTVQARWGKGVNGHHYGRPSDDPIVAFHATQDPISSGEVFPAMGTVRRLTPVECSRLQGLPDWWLDIEPPLSDSKKYHMVGNGGAVPVVRWIAERLKAVEEANQ